MTSSPLRDIARSVAGRPEIKPVIYPVANLFLRLVGWLRAQPYDVSRTVVVAASPRGGSTWLAETVAADPRTIMLWEPLHPGNNPVCQKHGFGWQNYVAKDANWDTRRRYLHDVLTGRDLSTRTLSSLEFRPKALLSTSGRYVAKLVNANLLLPHLVETFSVPAVQMIRHPCAVVSSQLAHGSWDHIDKSNHTVPPGLFEDYPHLSKVYERMDSLIELLAFDWAVQNYIPLCQPVPLPWYLTTYERMVLNGESEAQAISRTFDLSLPVERHDLSTPSATASGDTESPRDRLLKWRKNLEPRQVDKILSIAHAVGIECYTESPTPNESSLPRHEGSAGREIPSIG